MCVLIAGLSMIFAPLNVAAYLYTPRHLRAAAVGLLALLRNEGGSVGTSMAQTIQERREQFHTLRLGEYLDRFNPAVTSFARQSQAALYHATGDAVLAKRMSWQVLDDCAAAAGVVVGVFRCLLVLRRRFVRARIPRLLMKRSVAREGGARRWQNRRDGSARSSTEWVLRSFKRVIR